MIVQAILWCLLAAVTRAYSSFDLVCTRPIHSVTFVSSPDARGTMEILWGSLFTLIACTWTIHHPNVPEQRDGRNPDFKGDIVWMLKGTWESAKLALVTVLAPELIISVSLDQLRIAMKVRRQLSNEAAQDQVPWTLVHGHYAAMGGFVIRYNLSSEKARGGLPYHLTADDVIFLRQKGHLKTLPNITQDELCDKSKSDPLLKFIAIIQILWSIIQISTRAIRRLPISLLELNVLALAACALFIYALCWHKPKHVQAATTILTYKDDIPDNVMEGLEKVEMSAAWVILFDTAEELQVIRNTNPPKGAPLSNTRIQFSEEGTGDERPEVDVSSEKTRSEVDVEIGKGQALEAGDKVVVGDGEQGNGNQERADTNSKRRNVRKRIVEKITALLLTNGKLGVALSLFVAATLFGAVHVAGWNLSFPTHAEQIIWRCTGIYILTLPCMIVLIHPLGGFLFGRIMRLREGTVDSLLGLGGTLLCWLYLVARLFILVETVRTFLSLPPGVFVATWTVNIPHFA